MDERPLKPIMGFFQVYLQNHVMVLASHFLKVGNIFLENNSLIQSPHIV